MRVVILGCGRVGAELTKMLVQDNHQVSVIDWKPEAFGRLGEGSNVETVVGNGIDTDVLLQAGIQQADVFAAVTEGDNRNIMAGLVAKKLFKVEQILVRIYDPSRTTIYREMGLETICPTLAGAAQFYKFISQGQPMMSMSVDGGQHQVIEWLLTDRQAGKKVRSLPIPDEATIAAVIRDGIASVPLADTALKNGDRMIVLVRTHAMGRVRALMNSESGVG